MKRRVPVMGVGVCVGVQVGGIQAASHRGPDGAEQTTDSVNHRGSAASVRLPRLPPYPRIQF